MSYILNALRKSEQERLAQQAGAVVAGRILAEPPQPRPKTAKWLILLLLGNLMVVAFLFWFVRKEQGASLPVDNSKITAPQKIQLKPEIAPPVEIAAPPAKPVIKKAEPALPSIAELAAAEKTQAKPSVADKAGMEKNSAPIQRKPEPVKSETKTVEAAPIVGVEPVRMTEIKPEIPAENKKIPFLYELPAEFRHTVPDLKINVFVYSQQAAERFVMIDMVKYTVGQRIKDSVELKEIRPDSLIVEYNNQTFQIQRP